MKRWIETGFEYRDFIYSLKTATEPKDIYIPYAYTELTILKEWGYRISDTSNYGELSSFTQLILKYHAMMDAKLQEWQNKQMKKRQSQTSQRR
ncbi:hypothetical protein [Oceanotoga phage vB_OteS-UFV02]